MFISHFFRTGNVLMRNEFNTQLIALNFIEFYLIEID